MRRKLVHGTAPWNYSEEERSSQDSVELSQTSKGLFQLTMKLYLQDGQEADTVQRAKNLWQRVASEFPLVQVAEPPLKVKGEA